MKRIKEFYKIDSIVCLIQDHEFEYLQIQNYPQVAKKYNLEVIRYPIKDGNVPSDESSFKNLV